MILNASFEELNTLISEKTQVNGLSFSNEAISLDANLR